MYSEDEEAGLIDRRIYRVEACRGGEVLIARFSLATFFLFRLLVSGKVRWTRMIAARTYVRTHAACPRLWRGKDK